MFQKNVTDVLLRLVKIVNISSNAFIFSVEIYYLRDSSCSYTLVTSQNYRFKLFVSKSYNIV